MAARSSSPATPRPPTARERLAQLQQRQALLALVRVLALPIIILGVLGPHLPSPLFGVDWWTIASPWLSAILHSPMPPEPLDMGGVFTVPALAVGQWLTWGLAALLGVLAFGLVMHLVTVYLLPALRPLSGQRTYIRLLVPTNPAPPDEQSGALLRGLLEMAPGGVPGRARPAPVLLCWSAFPDALVEQGVSLFGPEATFLRPAQHRLAGVHPGTQAERGDDPLLAEWKDGRTLGAVEVRTLADTSLPIGDGESATFLRSLLTTLAPQAGVIAASVRVALEAAPPARTARIRLSVQALMESGKGDLGSGEQALLKAKVEQAHGRLRCWLIAVGEQPEAVTTQLQLLGTILAERSQTIGGRTQRLVAGPILLAPAVAPAPQALPASQRRLGWAVGLGAALFSLLVVVQMLGSAALLPLGWSLPLLAALLPPLALRARWNRREAQLRPAWREAVRLGVLPARNPGLIPLWSPWFSPREQD